jgi:hypothetical protein
MISGHFGGSQIVTSHAIFRDGIPIYHLGGSASRKSGGVEEWVSDITPGCHIADLSTKKKEPIIHQLPKVTKK